LIPTPSVPGEVTPTATPQAELSPTATPDVGAAATATPAPQPTPTPTLVLEVEEVTSPPIEEVISPPISVLPKAGLESLNEDRPLFWPGMIALSVALFLLASSALLQWRRGAR
jgi:hypothetical protein